MCGQWHRVVKSALIAASLWTVSCICLDTQPLRSASYFFPGLTEDQINWITTITFDVNDFAESRITADELTSRYKRFGRAAEIRVLPDIQTSYLLVTDHVLRRQTVVMPGTINEANLASDLDMVLTPDDELNIQVHRGYQLNAQAIRNDLRGRLSYLYPVWLSGFSLGGATSVLLGGYLQSEGFYIENITTYGQPKVTDHDGAAVLNRRLPIHRLIAGDDPVTTFPGLPFAHCGDAVILLDGPNIVRLIYGTEEYEQYDALALPLTEATFQVHITYVDRVKSKLDASVGEIAFDSRGCYLGL